MKRGLIVLSILMLTGGALAGEQTTTDRVAIESTITNYLEGWFSSDPSRMERALHPSLAKYNVQKAGKTDLEYLSGMTAEELVAMTHHNQEWVKDREFREMKILYQDQQLAVVHAVSDGFYDLCSLAKVNGEWRIVQVLWGRNDLGKKE